MIQDSLSRRLGVAAVIATLTLSSPAALGANADYQMFGAPPPKLPFTAPDRSFAVQLPPTWQAREVKVGAKAVQFRIFGAGDAWMMVRQIPIPEGAKPRQLLARAKEERLNKLPHFVEEGRRDVTFNGVPGAAIIGSFWYQGNAQYPRAVQEVFLIVGQQAFEFHLECFEPLAGQLAVEANQVYNSFVPHPANEPPKSGGEPADDDDDNPLDKIPF